MSPPAHCSTIQFPRCPPVPHHPLVILYVGSSPNAGAITLANGGWGTGRGAIPVYLERLTEQSLNEFEPSELAMVIFDVAIPEALEGARMVRAQSFLRTQVIVQLDAEEDGRVAELEETHEVSAVWIKGSHHQKSVRQTLPILLRAFEQLSKIEASRQQLLKILQSIGSILRQGRLQDCAAESLKAMAQLFGKSDGFLYLWNADLKNASSGIVGIGRYASGEVWEGSAQLGAVFQALHGAKLVVNESGLAIPICIEEGKAAAVIFLDGNVYIGGDAGWIAEVLASNIATAISRVGEEDRIAYLALHDESTRLPNRKAIELAIDSRLAMGQIQGAACVIEIQSYAEIEAAYGERVASRMMRVLAERLGRDDVGRVAPSQLALIDCSCNGPCPVRHQGFSDPVCIDDHMLPVQAEMGVCRLNGVSSGNQAIQNARAAIRTIYPAAVRNTGVRQYTEGDTSSLASKLTMISDLKQALATQTQLHVHYQPQFNIRTGEFIGVEALIRWDRFGVAMSPALFIPIAESCGLIQQLGMFSIREAIQQAAIWYAQGMPTVVGINLSPAQLSDPMVTEHILAWAKQCQIEPQFIEFELTETSATSHDTAVSVINRLRGEGFRIAIDDFGTGYSSLQRLANLHFDRIKIDREFVVKAGDSKNHKAVCELAANLGHALGVSVVAEGIETPEQASLMLEIGCREVQGFYYGRPVPADQITGKPVEPNPGGIIEWPLSS